jgi:long-chain acyl-CoA synthetase
MASNQQLITDVFSASVDKYRSNTAFTCLGRSMSFGELDVLSARFAAYLQRNTNLKPGDRIAIQLPNVLQYPVATFGAIRAGLVVVNTNPLYTPREVQHQLKDSGAKALVVLANVAASAASIIENTDVETVFVTEVADMHSPLKKILINSYLKYVQNAVPAYRFANSIAFSKALQAREDTLQPYQAKPEDVAVLQYTGGTTGVAKGAMLTHHNLVSNKDQLLERIEPILDGENLCFVTPLPLYHIYAFTCHCMANFSNGHHNLLVPNPRDINSLIKAMQAEKVFAFVGLNTLFNALLNTPAFHQLDFKSWKLTSSGGMALTKDTARRWEEATGNTPCEGYGLTETSPVVTSNPPDAIQLGTIGLPVIDTEVKIIDEQGNTVAQGEVGELCVRGPQVMKGYWQRPEETEKVIDADGWLSTGDMALQQGDGYLRIVDRKKDMILVSGFNVYPTEVEDVVSEHPGIAEAGAIGIADEHSGEVVKLFVVRADPNLDEDAVRAFCKKNMAAYKVPKHVQFCDALPKSPVGKILRRELKELQQKQNS